MSDSPTLGTMIREQRLEQGLSLGQLATKLGHTAASVRRWERGEDVPSNALIVRIADALHLDEAAMRAALTETPAAAATQPPLEDEPEPAPASAASAVDARDGSVASEPPGDVPADVPKEPEPAEPGAVVTKGRAKPEPPEPRVSSIENLPEPAPAPAPGDAKRAVPDREPGTEPPESPDEAILGSVPSDPKPVSAQAVAPTVPRPVAPAPTMKPAGNDRPRDITEAPTEAVPVVAPPRRVAANPRTPSVATGAIPPRPTVDRPTFQNPFAVLFDPEHRWLYWIRLALLIAASLVLLYVFIWAVGELWDSLGELLDTFGSTEEVSDLVEVDPGT